jgi:Arc/MetJ-type ribon-helix-helix transcriptional regulator
LVKEKYEIMRERVSITINKCFLDEINRLILKGSFSSISAVVEIGVGKILDGRSIHRVPPKNSKEKVTITMDNNYLREINYKIAIGTFTSISHAVDLGLRKFLEEYGSKKRD